jgi:hypothetical protein
MIFIPLPVELGLGINRCLKLEDSDFKQVIRFQEHNCPAVFVILEKIGYALVPN